MKTAYIVNGGAVINVIVLDDETDPADFGALFGPDGAGIGWRFDGENWTAPHDDELPPPSLTELFEQARQLVEAHVNDTAKTRRYSDAVSCASYVSSTNATWSVEAKAFVAWRDAVWSQVYDLEDKALAGELSTIPTAEELIAGLPAFAWPT